MEGLYMFAIMPPAELGERIQKERLLFSENYNCAQALKPPVHITLYEPFKQEEGFEQDVAALKKWANRQMPFMVELDNYGFFEQRASPVIFIKVIKSDSIASLRTGLLLELKKYVAEPDTKYLPNNKPIPKPKSQPFNPHFTIGYRDVKPEQLPDIKQDYTRRPFKDSFLCDAIYLWKHDGKNWQTLQTFKLAGDPATLNPPTLF